MEAYISGWLNLALRWLHIVAGAAWIGTSFYFNWLNHSLRPPDESKSGVSGELWAVHGGEFFRVEKFSGAPARMPRTLHWFKWEAYVTWLSGISLLILIYYLGADVFLVDAAVADLTPGAAVAFGVAIIAGAWFGYDLLCKAMNGGAGVAFTAVAAVLALALAWGLSQLFGSRAAYIHFGATLGTLMAANVFRVIIPSQKEMVAALTEGRESDPRTGRYAALRSLHNNYMTLPVLFVMVSNHYPFTYGHAWNWAVLLAISVIGVGTRHYFNLRHEGRNVRWILPAAALAMVALAMVTQPAPPQGGTSIANGAGVESVPFFEVQAIVAKRCTPCHSATPAQAGFAGAPSGLTLDTPDEIRLQAERIQAVAVDAQTMPLGNLTGITPEERALLGRWIASQRNK